MILVIIASLILYIVGFLLGRKYEKDAILDGVYGVLSQVNSSNSQVDYVTYYYTKEAYDIAVKAVKELDKDIIEGDNDE